MLQENFSIHVFQVSHINGTDDDLLSSDCLTGDIRLIGGENEYEGTVEICINQVWGSVCGYGSYYYGNSWDVQDGQVVCGQLGHQRLGLCCMHVCMHDIVSQYI